MHKLLEKICNQWKIKRDAETTEERNAHIECRRNQWQRKLDAETNEEREERLACDRDRNVRERMLK
ncbi:3561_t:CDS:2 [Cetraspora pellucida]|uniref:3561_t:CDS:1 n=1 Tax=Cetraspora pellucida TaxID=1433469 RepID=A0ACA9KVR6_9GLOM|nr:3561_t:CDS:2 [Cetraspora pellucida]